MRQLSAVLLSVLVVSVAGSAAFASVPPGHVGQQIEHLKSQVAASQRQIARLDAELAGQQEARDRLSDSFNRNASLFTYVSGALVVLLALGGVLATVFAYRGIGKYAAERVDGLADTVLAGRLSPLERRMEAEFEELRSAYDQKFADLYDRTSVAFRDAGA